MSESLEDMIAGADANAARQLEVVALLKEARGIVARYAESQDDYNACGGWADDTNPAHNWLARFDALYPEPK